MENFWAYCLLKFEQELSAQQYNTWIKPLKARVNGEAVQIVAPNKFVMQWVKSKFFNRIATIANELSPSAIVELIVDSSEQAATVSGQTHAKSQPPAESTVESAITAAATQKTKNPSAAVHPPNILKTKKTVVSTTVSCLIITSQAAPTSWHGQLPFRWPAIPARHITHCLFTVESAWVKHICYKRLVMS